MYIVFLETPPAMSNTAFPRNASNYPALGAIVLAMLLLFAVLAGCGGDSSDDASTEAGGPIEVSFVEGQISGGSLRTVDLGSEVTIEVTTDTDDMVHVHGYDLFEAVADGSPAVVTFTADIPGDFEVELEESGRLLFELRVS